MLKFFLLKLTSKYSNTYILKIYKQLLYTEYLQKKSVNLKSSVNKKI